MCGAADVDKLITPQLLYIKLNSTGDDARGRKHLSRRPSEVGRGGARPEGEGVVHFSSCRSPPGCIGEALYYPGFPGYFSGPLIKW